MWLVGWTVDNETVQLTSTEDSSESPTTVTTGGAAGNDAHMLDPDVLVSLTAPKRCSRGFRGRSHYVVQRFVPPELLRKYELGMAHVDAAVNLYAQLSLVELDTTNLGDADTADTCQQNDN